MDPAQGANGTEDWPQGSPDPAAAEEGGGGSDDASPPSPHSKEPLRCENDGDAPRSADGHAAAADGLPALRSRPDNIQDVLSNAAPHSRSQAEPESPSPVTALENLDNAGLSPVPQPPARSRRLPSISGQAVLSLVPDGIDLDPYVQEGPEEHREGAAVAEPQDDYGGSGLIGAIGSYLWGFFAHPPADRGSGSPSPPPLPPPQQCPESAGDENAAQQAGESRLHSGAASGGRAVDNDESAGGDDAGGGSDNEGDTGLPPIFAEISSALGDGFRKPAGAPSRLPVPLSLQVSSPGLHRRASLAHPDFAYGEISPMRFAAINEAHQRKVPQSARLPETAYRPQSPPLTALEPRRMSSFASLDAPEIPESALSFVSSRHASLSSIMDDLPPVKLCGRNGDADAVLDVEIASLLREHLPPRLRVSESWTLLYSLDQHGVSMATLYRLIKDRGPLVLAVKDSDGKVFGAYLSEPPAPRSGYYGTGECFLWRTMLRPDGKTPQVRAYPWTGENDYFISSEHNFIGVGGGSGRFGLYISDPFEKGYTETCATFANEALTGPGSPCEFDVLELEAWGFEVYMQSQAI